MVKQRRPFIDDGAQRAQKRRMPPAGIATAIIVLILILGLPALYRPTVHGKLRFDPSIIAELNTIRPDYLFIGNSMLRTRIDENTLTSHLGTNCCYVLWTGGAESAWDHQALKNYVLAAEHRPKRVFIFFRDAYLTRVTYRTDDTYWWKIERASHDHEPELMRAMKENRTWQESLEYELGLFYPIQKRRDYASYALAWLASEIISPGPISHRTPAASRYNELFDLDKLKNVEAADDATVGQEDRSIYDFDAKLPQSLLPSMIHLAQAAGVDLVFVRVQRRPTANGPPPQSQELRLYMSELQAYLAKSGAGFYDFTGDPELTLDHYLDGDHIRSTWRNASTELFLRRLQKYF